MIISVSFETEAELTEAARRYGEDSLQKGKRITIFRGLPPPF